MVPGFVGTTVWAAALALSALWAVGVVALALGTRHRAPVAGPPTADLPPAGLPPGVVAYLTQDLVVGEDAVESTLVDLAARGHVDLRQADRDPRSTTVHLTGHRVAAGDHLLPFEEQVLGRVGAVVRGGVAPVAALRARGGEDVAGWWRAFAAHVRAAARSAGLTRPRCRSRGRSESSPRPARRRSRSVRPQARSPAPSVTRWAPPRSSPSWPGGLRRAPQAGCCAARR